MISSFPLPPSQFRLRGWSGAAFLWTLAVFAVLAGATATSFTPARAQHVRSAAIAVLPAAGELGRIARSQFSDDAAAPIAGKGMWIYQFERIAGGDPEKVAYYAKQGQLTHIFVRVGSGFDGLKTLDQVGRVLAPAHRYGIKVIAWYFPYFNDIDGDVRRSVETLRYQNGGESFDGFAADIEPAPGANLNATTVTEYSSRLRLATPGKYLISVPPRPTKWTIGTFPYAQMMPWYDAVAPMIYWGSSAPGTTTEEAIAYLAQWGKPIAPIGQMYDMRSEGGPAGNPTPTQTWAFMKASKQSHALGISFWSWQDATSNEWRTLRAFPW